jgi:hypothetical protein
LCYFRGLAVDLALYIVVGRASPIEPTEWHNLAEIFEQANRLYRAAYNIEKLSHLESIRVGEQPSILLSEFELQKLSSSYDAKSAVEPHYSGPI